MNTHTPPTVVMTPSRPPTPTRSPRRSGRTIAAALVVAASAAVPTPALALFGVGSIVFDPKAKVENVAKVAAMAKELEQMAAQLAQLDRQIADLGGAPADPGDGAFGHAADAIAGLTKLYETLGRWTAELPAAVEPQQVRIGDLPARNDAIRGYLRDRVDTASTALAGVEADRQQVTAQVAAVVTASNGAEGPKAAQQAANDLHAIVAAEQAKLEALRAMRSRLAADARAADGAEEAAADAVRRGEQGSAKASAQQFDAEAVEPGDPN